MRFAGPLAALAVSAMAALAGADEAKPSFSDADILGKPPPYIRLESLSLRYTHFEQSGTGYQARGGPPGGPGDQALRVEQPQLEAVIKQGDKLTHRVWIPIDIVTAASPDAIDVVSTASRTNEAGSFDWTTTYKWSPEVNLIARSGMHNEENWRSWNLGFGFTRSFAEDNTVLEASVNQIADWFDKYTLAGKHDGHTARSSLSGSVGLTQVLSPTTIGHIDYGITLQRGQLSNGWNTVPLTTGDVALEILPKGRVRHALVGRIAQWLPWNGSAHGFYRFYVDDWGIRAHTMELELYQRIASWVYARANYRFHKQTAPTFFTTRATPNFTLATADSDLADLDAHTAGFKIVAEMPVRFAKTLRVDVAAERYFRSNDLRASVLSCGLGLLF
ncbi:Hypothetical protein A7982_10474 [Minicystis rosea]|nr:Hypothetical protein A7982_10474 [Minicystis rosea]